MNKPTAAANVGMNHLRSLGFSAGRKNARICHRMTGEQATTEAHSDTLKRTLKPSNGVSVVSAPDGRYSEIGIMRKSTTVAEAR